MTHLRWHSLVLLLAAVAGSGCELRARPGVAPRHMLLVSVRGLRADHCSFMMYERQTTSTDLPEGWSHTRYLTLDELSRMAVTFPQAFSPSPSADAAIATLLTGASPLATGVSGDGGALAPEPETLAEAFGRRAFETVALLTRAGAGFPGGFERGFSRFERFDDDSATLAAAADLLAEVRAEGARPLMLWLHLEGPALPYEPGVGHWPTRPDVAVEFERVFTDPAYGGDARGSEEYRTRTGAPGASAMSDQDRRHVVNLYDGEVAQLSARLFQLMDGFLQSNPEMYDLTVKVFCGVCGSDLPGADGWPAAGGVGDASLRVPLFLHYPPGLTGARIFGDVVGLENVAPTLRDWFALSPSRFPRGSLLAITDSYVQRTFDASPAFGLSTVRKLYTIRTDRWRLIADEARLRGQEGLLELRAVVDTLEEPFNRAEDRPEIVQELLDQLSNWIQESDSSGGG